MRTNNKSNGSKLFEVVPPKHFASFEADVLRRTIENVTCIEFGWVATRETCFDGEHTVITAYQVNGR